MRSMMGGLARLGGAVSAMLALLLFTPTAGAQSCGTLPCSFTGDPVINSNPNLTSSSDFMISYRDEQHSWQTSDGQTHFLINTGSGAGRGLQIWTRYVDSGNNVTWVAGPVLPQTSSTYSPSNPFTATSTADGRLTVNSSTGQQQLAVVYTTTLTGSSPGTYSGGNVNYMLLDYTPTNANASTTGWILDPTVFNSSALSTIYTVPSGYYAVNPTIALDTTLAAVPWAAFTLTQCPYFSPASTTSNCLPTSTIKLSYLGSVSSAPKWVDTKLQFGPTDGNYVSTERSARLVATANAVGMVYQVHQSFFWTYRLNSASLSAAWSAPQAFFTSTPENSSQSTGAPYDNNPYASHFSVLPDTDNPAFVPGGTEAKIHMVTVDHSRLLYFGYAANQNTGWSNPSTLLAANEGPGGVDTGASYPQIFFAPKMNSASGSTQYHYLAAVVNNTSAGNLFQSTDIGQTWSAGAILNHPSSLPVGDFSNPRFEVPQAIITADVPLVQQYVDSSASTTYDNLLLSFDLAGLVN